MSSEMQHILNLPTRALHPQVSKWTRRLQTHPQGPDLLPGQALMLSALTESVKGGMGPDGARGCVGIAGCGTGKTLFYLLAGRVAWAQSPLLILPANLIEQTRQEALSWGGKFRLSMPRMLSYGKLSHPSGAGLLEEIQPDLIMLDEAHLVGTGARYKRLWRYAMHNKDCRFVAASGSFVAGDIRPLGSIMALCLRDWSPMPVDPNITELWASVVNVGGEPDAQARRAFAPLLQWAALRGSVCPGFLASPQEQGRHALFERMAASRGVAITTGPLDVGASLRLRIQEPEPSQQMRELEDLWQLPDGTELVDAIEIARHRRTMRLGFFYRWKPETFSDVYQEERRRWQGKLRSLVEYAGFDSPSMAVQAIEDGNMGSGASRAYERWLEVSARIKPPETEAVFFDPKRAEHLVRDWLLGVPDTKRAVIWCRSRALRHYMRNAGFKVHWAGDKGYPPDQGPVVVSTAYRRGWNGQHFTHAFVLEPPTNGRRMEQLISRHHRTGQLRDVEFTFYTTAWEKRRMTQRARMAQQTTHTPQRWIIGDWCEE